MLFVGSLPLAIYPVLPRPERPAKTAGPAAGQAPRRREQADRSYIPVDVLPHSG